MIEVPLPPKTVTAMSEACLLCGNVDKRRIIGVLRSAIMYLEHPDIVEVSSSFVISSKTQARRCRELIRDLGGDGDE